MSRFALTIAYDGSSFAGWQRQRSFLTAQQVVEEALSRLWGCRVIVHGASRTDAGVHALGQCAHFDAPEGTREFDPNEILNALNAYLPTSLRILAVRRVSKDFHAQFSALEKMYSYRIYNSRILPPLEVNRCWHIIKPLDIAAMQKAAGYFIGKKDFGVLGVKSKTVRENTVRTIHVIKLMTKGKTIWVYIKGDGFLYKMVRGIVGALVSVGKGKVNPEWAQELLQNQKRDPRLVTAPAYGLCLMAVRYKGWVCGEKKCTWC